MPSYNFERECRTSHSEVYTILDDEIPIGRLDIHFATPIVHATLSIPEGFTQEEIEDLIETIDDDLVDIAGVTREEFIVHVHLGRDGGVYSDQDFNDGGDTTSG